MRARTSVVALVAGLLSVLVLPAWNGEFATLVLAGIAWWAGTRRFESRTARAMAAIGRALAVLGAGIALLILLFRLLAALDVAE